MMNLLLILLSAAVATFTIESKDRVTADGSWPYDMDAKYSNNYQKGQVRAGDEAILTVTGLDGIVVESVEVYVKSNQSSGAGKFTVKANDIEVATKTGTFEDWFGAYDSQDFHALSLIDKKIFNVQTLTVTLNGMTNSLTIEKYVITWSQVVEPSTVTLMNDYTVHATLTETKSGAGVYLPSLPDLEHWHFEAWTAEEFEEDINTLPESWITPGLYHPEQDCTLWAVYSYIVPSTAEYITELESGTYFYVDRNNNLAMTGVPSKEGSLSNNLLDLNSISQQYNIDFVPTKDTAYITHAETQTPIGYNTSTLKMKAVLSPWLVYHEGESTLFYANINNKPYVLLISMTDGSGNSPHVGLYLANPGPSPMSLCRKQNTEEPRLSCHPNGKQSIFVTPQSSSQEVIVPFGIYELHIKDGQKTLYIR